MSKYVVVLTGGIGSGKSLVSSYFEDLGITIIEQDDISREIVKPGEPALVEIAKYFGSEILHTDGTLNRPALRQRVFSNAQERLWLNQLTHPLIGLRTREYIDAASSKYTIVVNPLLGSRQSIYDRFLVVDAPLEVQVMRTMQRDDIDAKLAWSMVKSQTSREHRLNLADDVIVNVGAQNDIRERVKSLHRRYLVLARD